MKDEIHSRISAVKLIRLAVVLLLHPVHQSTGRCVVAMCCGPADYSTSILLHTALLNSTCAACFARNVLRRIGGREKWLSPRFHSNCPARLSERSVHLLPLGQQKECDPVFGCLCGNIRACLFAAQQPQRVPSTHQTTRVLQRKPERQSNGGFPFPFLFFLFLC